jgi:hypothetical protein
MGEFYRVQRKERTTKPEALQRVQEAMVEGQIRGEGVGRAWAVRQPDRFLSGLSLRCQAAVRALVLLGATRIDGELKVEMDIFFRFSSRFSPNSKAIYNREARDLYDSRYRNRETRQALPG